MCDIFFECKTNDTNPQEENKIKYYGTIEASFIFGYYGGVYACPYVPQDVKKFRRIYDSKRDKKMKHRHQNHIYQHNRHQQQIINQVKSSGMRVYWR